MILMGISRRARGFSNFGFGILDLPAHMFVWMGKAPKGGRILSTD